MIGLNRQTFLNGWWTVTFPGLAIFSTVLSFLIGEVPGPPSTRRGR